MSSQLPFIIALVFFANLKFYLIVLAESLATVSFLKLDMLVTTQEILSVKVIFMSVWICNCGFFNDKPRLINSNPCSQTVDFVSKEKEKK